MEENRRITINDAIHRIQLILLEGIDNEDKLFAASSIMSRSDYLDVVTERTIAKACGYPLCDQSLPAERSRKGRYMISVKEHKVYDLHETYLYCSTGCAINSRAFATNFPNERCNVLNSKKLNNVLKLFERKSLETEKGLETEGDFGMSKLKIQENDVSSVAGLVSLEEWIGPSNAIEGYVPQSDQMLKSSQHDQQKGVSKKTKANNKQKRVTFNETEFRSTIITSEESTMSKPTRTSSQLFNELDFVTAPISSDEYTISKLSPSSSSQMIEQKAKLKGGRKGKTAKKEMENEFTLLDNQSGSMLDGRETFSKEPKQEKHFTSDPQLEIVSANISGVKEEYDDVKATSSSVAALKSCLKSAGVNKASQSVRWDESIGNSNQPKVQEFQNVKESSENVMSSSGEVNDDELRRASAEACARALTEAATAISSGEIDVSDALSEAGIIVLPYPDTIEPEQEPTKLLKKPGVPNYNLFESEDSWYDSTPEGFSLTLSSFATMWMALFAWTSSSSLAFIYGRNEDDHEDFVTVNGREYPQKIVLSEGRSSEIKQTFSGCLARALPGVITDLRLSTPVSTLEKELGLLLETMSFVDPLPGFRMKQWRVIVFLFIEVLSVSRIPALTAHMTNRRIFLNKVLEGAQISVEEYETMKELMIPLGRVPEFSMQSGG
ncbi:putative RNA polymerase II subunit B1 CTD phosphatase RPAP2 homolog [Impatiens glandulifera]|uniref:putative RNA polymerase II subunit B1 CTD phosphatase RPAP2 homolog n=1 Tax=Impatiens glandulifera TaxID=253017 RepID=UPI001FB1903E|nr:putative RNA polymerase II subunit B1 CTD phosphatase RPAP2 homolog [Impatiens glandulifera]